MSFPFGSGLSKKDKDEFDARNQNLSSSVGSFVVS